jgi:phospholipase D1/2
MSGKEKASILVPGRNCLGVFEADACGLLVDARDYYRAFASAARNAKRFVLIAGWQFDSEVRLLRGKDAKDDRVAGDSLLKFFNDLCAKNPALEIYILAWDYSVLFALEREWFQAWVFNKKTNDRIQFRFDSSHAAGASHHQKFVVIDGIIGFAGGMDICAERWDDRQHRFFNPYRTENKGEQFGPYHDIQAFVSGPAARSLADLFIERWENSGGGRITLPVVSEYKSFGMKRALAIASREVGISRTWAKTLIPLRDSVREIRRLYLDAIASADSLIYMENQYFSSQAVFSALTERMRDAQRPRLEIVLIFPRRPTAFIEELSMGLAQARIFKALEETASRYGHALGLYYAAVKGPGDKLTVDVYIHSKLIIIDDRFLTVGSANTTNRSMGLDTELNLAWEAVTPADKPLVRSIRRIRKDLLAEHTGMRWMRTRSLDRAKGIVSFLDRLAASDRCRLCRLQVEDYLTTGKWLRDLSPEDIAMDPESPIIEESIFEMISADKSGFFAKGITVLNIWLRGQARITSPENPNEKDEISLSDEPKITSRLSLLTFFVILGGILMFFLLLAVIIGTIF